MSNAENFIVKLKGNSEKLKSFEDVISEAAYQGGGDMEALLEDYGININGLEIDADCHHISLFTYLFGLCEYQEELESKAGRNFINGCSLDDDTMTIYVYGPDGGEDFFKRLTELASDIESYTIEDDPDYDDEDDYDDEEDDE